jgi:DNA-directed RNA polymerase subunit M/transcription elongation factor TFIIS
MKICLKCNSEKELSEFNKDKRNKSGYNTQCRKCVNERRNSINNPISVESKNCSNCNIDKTYTLFKRQKDSSDGLFHMCKVCFNIWRKNHREKEEIKLKQRVKKLFGVKI